MVQWGNVALAVGAAISAGAAYIGNDELAVIFLAAGAFLHVIGEELGGSSPASAPAPQ